MRFAVDVPNFGDFADPWILLPAAVLATDRIRLGTMVTSVARRRVSKLAREVTTLDRQLRPDHRPEEPGRSPG